MTAQELLAKVAQQRQEVLALQTLWEQLFPEFNIPADRQFQIWLNRHPLDIVADGLTVTNQWFQYKLMLAALPELPENPRHVQNEEGEEVAVIYGTEELTDPKFADTICTYASGCMKRKANGDDGQA